MEFKVNKNNKQIKCDIIMAFRDNNNNSNYIVYTDDTKDKKGNLEIYASKYVLKNDEYILEDIKTEYEWNMVDNMLKSKFGEE